MKKLYAFLILLVLFLSSADAQGAARNGRARVKHNADKNHVDTVPSLLYQHYFGQLDSLNNDTVPMRYIESDPDYYQLFVPIAYYYAPIKQASEMNWSFQMPDSVQPIGSGLLSYNDRLFNKTARTNKQVNKVLLNLYVNRPDLVVTKRRCWESSSGYS